MTFTQLLQKTYPKLTKSEKKIADYILSNMDSIVYSTMHDIRNETEVGDATIMRFCHKLGFSGFSDLKIEIAKDDFTKHYETKDEKYYDQTLDNLKNALDSTRYLINDQHLTKAIQQITKAKYLYIFGVGSSGNTCMMLEKMFLRVGVHSKALIDPHYQAQSASLLSEEDVVIGFSLSGETKDTYDSLKIAKDNGAKIIAVTNYLSSPIAGLGDIVLQTSVKEFLNGGSLEGNFSQLYLCDVLVRGYEKENQINVLKLREKVLRSIMDKSLE